MWRIEITKRLKFYKDGRDPEEVWHIKMNGEDDDDVLMDIDCLRSEAGALLSTLADGLVEPQIFTKLSQEQLDDLDKYGV